MNQAMQRQERLHSAKAPLKVSTGEMKPEEWELSLNRQKGRRRVVASAAGGRVPAGGKTVI
jgi:hypothetical protein